jgi:hypothetical protein
MIDENQALRIMSELTGYFWRNHIYMLNVTFKPGSNCYEILISGFSPSRPADLDEFKTSLQKSGQPELAEYYDHLLGFDGGDYDSYHFLGALIDQADISYENQILSVKVTKEK